MNNTPLDVLFEIIEQRKQSLPESSYTASLLKAGENKLVKKLGEEFSELIVEIAKGPKERIIEESTDLIYHLLVLLASKDINLQDLYDEIEKRHK